MVKKIFHCAECEKEITNQATTHCGINDWNKFCSEQCLSLYYYGQICSQCNKTKIKVAEYKDEIWCNECFHQRQDNTQPHKIPPFTPNPQPIKPNSKNPQPEPKNNRDEKKEKPEKKELQKQVAQLLAKVEKLETVLIGYDLVVEDKENYNHLLTLVEEVKKDQTDNTPAYQVINSHEQRVARILTNIQAKINDSQTINNQLSPNNNLAYWMSGGGVIIAFLLLTWIIVKKKKKQNKINTKINLWKKQKFVNAKKIKLTSFENE